MIVKMHRVTLLVSARDREASLQRLRDLGVVHVDAAATGSEDVQAVEAEMENVDQALRILGAEDGDPGSEIGEAPSHLEEILGLTRQRDELSRERDRIQEQSQWFGDWGAVSLASLKKLRQAGVVVRFYVIDQKALKELPSDAIVQVVKTEQKRAYIAQIATADAAPLGHKELELPLEELSSLEAQVAGIEADLKKADDALSALSGAGPSLLAYRADLEKRLEFNRARASMGGEGRIAYLQGYCPVDAIGPVEEAASQEGWGCMVAEPDDPDQVPILIRTPRWVRIIEPVFSFIGTVPGYREYDISLWFLLFFSLFFALLIGDAGYGLGMIVATFLLSRKLSDAPREVFLLMYVLGGATLAWGAVTGTWFGHEQIAQLPFLRLLVVDRVNSFVGSNQDFMMLVCFTIGVVHLTLARTLVAVRHSNSLTALAEVGWIGILWCLYFLAGMLVLKRPAPDLAWWLGGGGLVLVLFFSNPQKGFLLGPAISFGDAILKGISSFSDVVSYLRLFAVGYATVIVASSFNGIALDIGFGSVVGSVGAALVLVLGHTINIVLGLMAVVVHGVRLNMLEFSGHLNMQWSGKPYKPFKT